MKILVLGDVHGRDFWKKVIEAEQTFDKVVFIGDYFDNYPPHTPQSICENFFQIAKLKLAYPDKVVLLIGNHDFHYMYQAENDKYSGFHTTTSMHVTTYLREFAENSGNMQVCWQYKDIVFSHAGITKTWLLKTGKTDFLNVVDHVNQTFWEHPELFRFFRGDLSGFGEHREQSPIWVRPHSLQSDMLPDFKQVVGHTTIEEIKSIEDSLVLIDAPKALEYLVIENDVVSVRSLKPRKP